MPTENKQIKLGFVVDDASVQKAQAALQSLITASQKLQEIWSKTGMGGTGSSGLLSGVNVGGGGGGGVPGYQSPQGPNRAIAPGASPAAFAASRLTADLTKQRDILKNLSTEANNSMKVMSDGLRRSVDSQKRDLDSLQKSAENLLSTYKDLGQTSSTGVGTGGYSYVSGNAAEGRRAVSKSPAQTIVDPDAPAKMSGGGGGGGGTAGGSAAGGISPGFLKAFLPRLGLAAAGVAGLNSIANEIIDNPLRYSRAAAARGDVFASAFRATAMGGDLTYAFARDAIKRDSGLKSDWDALSENQRQQMLLVKTGVGNVLTGKLGDAFGNAVKGMADPLIQTKIMKDQMEMIENQKRADPRMYGALEYFAQNSAGNVALARSLGLGGMSADRAGNVNGGAEWLKNRLQHEGFDIGQYTSAFGGVQGTGGRSAATRGGLVWNAMAAALGGMGNAAGVAGLAAVGGQGAGFMGNLYGASGRNGFDVVAAGQIGEAIARGIGSNGILTSGMGALNAATGVGGTGGPRDMMIARQIVSGMGGLGDTFSGNLDPFQKALNINNAIKNGATGWASSNMLANQLTPGQMMDILKKNAKGGYDDLPPELKSLGITREMVQKQFSDTTGSIISRAAMLMGGDTSSSSYKTLSSIMESGMTPAEWMKSRTRGMGKKAKGAFLEQSIADIGVGIANATGSDFLTGEGEARILLGVGSKGRRGGPQVGGAGIDQEHQRGMAESFKKNVLDVLGSDMKGISDASLGLKDLANSFGTSASNLAGSAAAATKALDTLAEAALRVAVVQAGGSLKTVNDLVRAFRGKVGQLQAGMATEKDPVKRMEDQAAIDQLNNEPKNSNPAPAPKGRSPFDEAAGGLR